mgnify:CR=1 FL=1
MSEIPPAEWIRESSRRLLQTRVFEVQAREFRHPQRDQGKEFFVIDAPDWAVVAPITPGGELILVNQFRFGSQELSLELPGGVVEPGEEPAAAAARELAEETGYVGAAPVLLGSVYPNPAIQSNRAHLILIPEVKLTRETAWDVDEELGLLLAPIGDVLQWARAGKITHALMLNMLFMLEPWWRRHFTDEGSI